MQAFVIGDIHGCLDELKELIKDVDRTKTKIILIGDLIDRGKDSRGVIDFVRSNNIECVKGNHELMAEECLPALKEFISNNSVRHKFYLYESDWFYNGGHDVFNQYSSQDALTQLLEDIEWLSTLPLSIETGIVDEFGKELLVSHTWCSLKDLSNPVQFDFVWDRVQPTQVKNKTKYYNIYGHTPTNYVNSKKYARMQGEVIPEPEYYDCGANIDTGCAYNVRGRGYLTGIYFPSLDIRQIKLKD